MSQLELLKRTIRQLKNNVDILQIRMTSCQQIIQKILKIVTKSDSPNKNLKSPGRSINRSINQQESKNYQKSNPLIKDFLLFHSPQVKAKNIDINSFTLMKNAILANSYQVQSFHTKIQQIQSQNNYLHSQQSKKICKIEEAVQLLTKLLNIIDKKLTKYSQITPKKYKTKNKSITNRNRLLDYVSL